MRAIMRRLFKIAALALAAASVQSAYAQSPNYYLQPLRRRELRG